MDARPDRREDDAACDRIGPVVDQHCRISARFPLGSTSRVVLTDATARYFGMIETSKAFDMALDPEAEVGALAAMGNVTLSPADDVRAVMAAFDSNEADYLAVVGDDGKVLGTLSETFVRRRYADEMEKSNRETFGE
jgi:hypothetical protein